MVEQISIPERTHSTSTKATEVTFPLEALIRTVWRALLQLYILYGVALASPKLFKISLKVARNFFKKLLKRCPKEIKKTKLLLSFFIWSDAKVHESKISKHFYAILRRNRCC